MKHLILACGLVFVSSLTQAQEQTQEQPAISAPAPALAPAVAPAPAPAPAPVPKAAESTPEAQGKRPAMQRHHAELNLTDEQVEKMREIRNNGGTRAEMQAVLTPEQRAKSAALRNKYGNEGANRKTRMKEQLGLSDEQVTKMQQIRQRGGSQQEMRAVLMPEQQAKFDTLRSQYPRPKSPHAPAAKPAPAPAPAAAPPSQ